MKTFKAVLWSKARADGARHIKICISENRKIDFFPLKIFVHLENFTSDHLNWIPSNVANATRINVFIKEILEKFQELDINHPGVPFKEIMELFKSGDKIDFYSFLDDQFELMKKSISKGTAKTYGQLKGSLENYAPVLFFHQIDYEFLARYEGHLKESGLLQTTVYKRMKIFKMYINEAFRMGKIKVNPFGSYKLHDGKANRQYLDKSSIEKIKAADLNNYEAEARTKFLFQCYTGLSFSDLIDLKWSEIRDNVIYRERIKTKETLLIPLIPEALEILNKQKTLTQKVNENIFSKISNQKYNEFLHAIEARAELTTPLTSHIARHTFATLALDAGVSMAVVSSILGHTNIRTTQIYGKITKSLKEEELRKLKF